MNSIGLSIKNLVAKPLNTSLSLILLSFGVGIISFMLILNKQLEDQFSKNIKGIEFVVGAKGSPLQLILGAVYQVDDPIGNINYLRAKQFVDTNKILIDYGIPLAFGDNVQGYRIVGTDHKYVDHYELEIAEGGIWNSSMEVTLGSKLATDLNLKIGDTFYSSHGLIDSKNVHDNKSFIVKGIFKPSGTVADQLALTAIESLWEVHNLENNPLETQEVTAYLIKRHGRSAMAHVVLPRILKDSDMMLAKTASEKNRLDQKFGIGKEVITWLAYIIIFISFISVFISLFNSLKERKYELAILRTMGATQLKLFTIIILEGLMLAVTGLLIGLALGRVALYIMNSSLEKSFHYDIAQFNMLPQEWVLSGATLLVGILAAFIPALRSIQMDISKTLSEN